jgi:hypothetical protein
MMTEEAIRRCEYCDARFLAGVDRESSERFCSSTCRAAAWAGGNPHVMAVTLDEGWEFVELPPGGDEIE